MSVYLDTSAILPLLDRDDLDHQVASDAWEEILSRDETVVTSSYVVVEAFALVQNRLGLGAARGLRDDLCPALTIEWVDSDLHEIGTAALFAAGRRQLSLVDCVSFEVMRRLGIRKAFAFDAHFAEQGFEVVPGPG